ncbi:glutathione S-transferase [Ramicandelaber brevisporus]|nr:glutathione S-transferase [Ramicandelaber brevisporus]KAI8865321.1 glutathione S-transferase [Ramicandelaber brevisporus]
MSLAITAADTTKHFTLYAITSANPLKVLIALETLGFTSDDYNVVFVDIRKNVQKQPWFLALNPNGRVPVLTDHRNGDFHVFESGAILQYLAAKYDPEHKIAPARTADLKDISEVEQWLHFQMGGVGPMYGQYIHFIKYAPEKLDYAIKRYKDESRRLAEVINTQLTGKQWLAAGQFSIADIANFSWLRFAPLFDFDFTGLENLKQWIDRLEEKPEVKRAVASLPAWPEN